MSLLSLPRTQSVLQAGIDEGLHPGAQIYVSLNGHVVVDDALGSARPNVAMTRDTLTLWMSAGKPVTAVAAMQLVDRGLISLDTKIADVIPEFGQHGKEAITLRHILTHTAGFRGPLNNFTPGTWDEILQRVYALKQEPGWVPGEKAGYHIGSSWFVLGELVRRLDGPEDILPFSPGEDGFLEAMDNRVFLLIQSEMFFGAPATFLPSIMDWLSPMYVTEDGQFKEFGGSTLESLSIPRPGANALGPIRALGQFYELVHQAAFNGENKILSQAIAQQAVSRQRVGMLDQTFKQVLDWGFGFMIDSKQYAGEHAYGFGPHASPDTFGHSGNQSSCAYCDPKHNLVVAWTCNGMPGEAKHQARASAINRAIYEDLGLG